MVSFPVFKFGETKNAVGSAQILNAKVGFCRLWVIKSSLTV